MKLQSWQKKGFDIPTNTYFSYFPKISEYGLVYVCAKLKDYNSEDINNGEYRISRPTQALLAKWLREKYEIHVEVVFWYYKDSHYCEYTYNITKPLENLTNNVLWFDNYEEAMEEGLKEALKLI